MPFAIKDIDYSFIIACEGGERGLLCEPHIPRDNRGEVLGHSGVTFSAGIDIGQIDEAELAYLTQDYPKLHAKLLPFIGKQGKLAVVALQQNPTSLSNDEAEFLCHRKYNAIVKQLIKNYDNDKGEGAFVKLERRLKTVILSVAVQYGANLAKVTPRFWRHALNGDSTALQKELRNFGDKYKTRRKREADYLSL